MPRKFFECALCCEDKFEALPRWVGDSRICDSCAEEAIKPLFHGALGHEHKYPPMWGREKLDVWTFWDLFDEHFREAWPIKEKEYATPAKTRLYCEHRDKVSGIVCGEFLGKRGLGLALCSKCQCHTCRACKMSVGNAASPERHTCKWAIESNPFEKLQRGFDYQNCPGCQKEIFPAEGCNHMTCRPPCSAHFCFVCGQAVEARRSGHWQQGGCPRFGVAGPRIIFDNPDEHSEAGTDESDNSEEDGDIGLVERMRDVARIGQLVDIFDNAADAERLESNRTRYTRGVASPNSEARFRFFGYVSTNLAIVLQVMRTRFDVEDVSDLLREFSERHQRINHQYPLLRDNAEAQVGTVTQLSDLSNEFDSYFVFALETMADLMVIADGHRRRT